MTTQLLMVLEDSLLMHIIQDQISGAILILTKQNRGHMKRDPIKVSFNQNNTTGSDNERE